MADELMTLDDMAAGKLDFNTLKVFANGDENTVNYPRLLPNVDVGSLAELRKKALEKIPVNATSFKTKADLTADTTLADNSFAFVHDDVIAENNGLYQKVSGAWVYQKWNLYAPLKSYVDTTLAKRPTLSQLRGDLQNPLLDVNIKLVGDSITWGMTTTNQGATTPWNGTLTDIRNNSQPTAQSWANLLSQWLVKTYTDGSLNFGEGMVWGESVNTVLISANIDLFSFKNKIKDFTLTESKALVKTLSNSPTLEYVDLHNINSTQTTEATEVSFYANGDSITLNHGVFNEGSASNYYISVYIDDVYSAQIRMYGSTAMFTSTVIALPDDGKHKITLRNNGSQNKYARIAGITSNKRVTIVNHAVIGSSTASWLTKVKLSDSIKRKDDFVFVMLGTNDRTKTNNTLAGFAKNLAQIVDDIYTLSSNNAKVILMSANDVTQSQDPTNSSYGFTQKTANAIISTVAKTKDVSFISNYAATTQLKIDGVNYLADGLHPNDTGHRAIFDNIKQAILNA